MLINASDVRHFLVLLVFVTWWGDKVPQCAMVWLKYVWLLSLLLSTSTWFCSHDVLLDGYSICDCGCYGCGVEHIFFFFSFIVVILARCNTFFASSKYIKLKVHISHKSNQAILWIKPGFEIQTNGKMEVYNEMEMHTEN